MNKRTLSFISLLLLCFIGTAYILYCFYINKNIFSVSSFNYYNYLLDAFFHGRLNVLSPNIGDLSFYHNKWFLYWGPAPALIIFPFFIFGGILTSDILYTLLIGIGNIFLFYFILKQALVYFKLHLHALSFWILILFFSFGSPNFYLSLSGRVWHTEEIIGTFYILFCLLFYFKYLNSSKLRYVFFSVIFFNLAWLSRYALIFYASIFLYPLILSFKNRLRIVKIFTVIALPSLLFFIFFFFYNYQKFQNPLETGLQYHHGHPRFNDVLISKKFLSTEYISYNASYYFFHFPKLSSFPPFFSIDLEGNSIFLFYPYTLLLPGIPLVMPKIIKSNRKEVIFFFCFGLTILSAFALYLLYFTTGWTQVGNRYILDIMPAILILIMFLLPYIPRSIQLTLLCISMYLNIYGALLFYK